MAYEEVNDQWPDTMPVPTGQEAIAAPESTFVAQCFRHTVPFSAARTAGARAQGLHATATAQGLSGSRPQASCRCYEDEP